MTGLYVPHGRESIPLLHYRSQGLAIARQRCRLRDSKRQRPIIAQLERAKAEASHAQMLRQRLSRRHMISMASSTEPGIQERDAPAQERGEDIELDPESEEAKKIAEADRLRKAEKFLTITTGKALCVSCGYEYEEKRGDQEYPITPGTKFSELPKDWQCPVCGAPRASFQSQAVKVAGFAENQQYGFGGNSLTSGQKSLLIYGSLILFFGLFLAGYTLQ